MVTNTQQAAPERHTEKAADAGLTYQPDVDICDYGADVTITADVPGARPDGIDVAFDDGVLTVHAAVPCRQLPGRPVRQEYGVGGYRRSFRIGEGFDASQISAEYRRGVLTIRVPRLAAVRPRKIAVRTA
jgi:HSP20 family protein